MRTKSNAWHPTAINDLRRLHDQGLSWQEIADSLGVVKSRITTKAKALGLRANVKRRSKPKVKVKSSDDLGQFGACHMGQRTQADFSCFHPGPEVPRYSAVDRPAGGCHWPYGHYGDANFGYCGKPTCKASTTYCEQHYSISTASPQDQDTTDNKWGTRR